jgi:hypothetical protein
LYFYYRPNVAGSIAGEKAGLAAGEKAGLAAGLAAGLSQTSPPPTVRLTGAGVSATAPAVGGVVIGGSVGAETGDGVGGFCQEKERYGKKGEICHRVNQDFNDRIILQLATTPVVTLVMVLASASGEGSIKNE